MKCEQCVDFLAAMRRRVFSYLPCDTGAKRRQEVAGGRSFVSFAKLYEFEPVHNMEGPPPSSSYCTNPLYSPSYPDEDAPSPHKGKGRGKGASNKATAVVHPSPSTSAAADAIDAAIAAATAVPRTEEHTTEIDDEGIMTTAL